VEISFIPKPELMEEKEEGCDGDDDRSLPVLVLPAIGTPGRTTAA
jgi:hypothetical protein